MYIIIITILLLYFQIGFTTKSRSGEFKTSDGSHCTWFDLRTGQTSGAIATACMCKDSQGNSQSYGCQYNAELYTCEEFIANSDAVLDDVVQRLSGMNNSCQAATLPVPKCEGLVLERDYLQQLSKPCVPHETKQEL